MSSSLPANLEHKRVGVCLSSGFFGFFAHLGFMRAVSSLGVEPAAISGSSAGALVGSLVASGLDEPKIRELLLGIRPRDLLDPPRPADLLGRPLGLIRGDRLERDLAAAFPVSTFEECPVPVAVTVFDLEERRLRAIERGPLAPAVRGSLSLPGMFCVAKVEGHACWDGGVVEKTPISPLARRGDLDVVIVSYLQRPRPPGAPRSLFGGIRAALDSHSLAAGRRDVAAARASGLEVVVVAPRVPRCGPHLLGEGPAIIDTAEEETLRILRTGDLGCAELS